MLGKTIVGKTIFKNDGRKILHVALAFIFEFDDPLIFPPPFFSLRFQKQVRMLPFLPEIFQE